MKILIFKFGALGDVIRTSYILPRLHAKYDNPVIDWVTSNSAYDLLRFNPHIRTLASPQTGLSFFDSNHYDLVLSFDDEYEVLKLIDNVSYTNIIGAYVHQGVRCYSDDSSEWFDMGLISRHGKNIADFKKKKNRREHNRIFGDMLQIEIDSGSFFNSSLTEGRIKKGFDTSHFNIGINPSAGARWKSKEMPLAECCCLIEKLLQYRIDNRNIKIHLLGGAAEEGRNAEIAKDLSKSEIRDWGGKNTLLEFAAIVKGCDYIISSDSLSLHLAVAQKIPNLSFYAPTSADEIGTFGTGVKVISLAEDYCSYRSDADNSTLTASRIFDAFKAHCHEMNLQIQSRESIY